MEEEERREKTRENLRERLSNNPAWPVKGYKLEMEKYDIYQDETGKAVDKADDIEKVTDQYAFYVRAEASSPDIMDTVVGEKTARFYEFLNTSGRMANLCAYVTLCDIYNDLEVVEDVHPEDDYAVLDTTRTPDALIRFPREYAPVEVYNGADYLNERTTDKYNQLRDLSSDDDTDTKTHPILINRRSTSNVKNKLRKECNATVVDTDTIIALDSIYEDYEECLDFLKIKEMITEVPELEGANGDLLTGDDYDIRQDGRHEYNDTERKRALNPPTELAHNVGDIPNEYMRRVRGGVKLHYVNTLYRRLENPTTAERATRLVIQQLYNNILRDGLEVQTAIDAAWNDAKENYRWLGQSGLSISDVKSEVISIIDQLESENIIVRDNGTLTAGEDTTHPQPTFSFEN